MEGGINKTVVWLVTLIWYHRCVYRQLGTGALEVVGRLKFTLALAESQIDHVLQFEVAMITGIYS